MKKLLGFLLTFQLMAVIVALVLGSMLYQRRQVLLGRTVKLETTLARIAATIETRWKEMPDADLGPARDVDTIGDRPLATPRVENFWEDYQQGLESFGRETLALSDHARQLRHYYRLDPQTLKPIRDPLTGNRITDGPHTMQAVLDKTTALAQAQLDRLNATRTQLIATREALTDTTTELNTRRHELRLANGVISESNDAIAALNGTVIEHAKVIEEQRAELANKELTVLDLNQAVAYRDESILDLKEDKRLLKERLATYLAMVELGHDRAWPTFTPGEKGRVCAVNNDRRFVVVGLEPAFIEQYKRACEIGEERPEPALTIVRNASNGEDARVIGKARLNTVDPESGLASADLLPLWEQGLVQIDDRLLY